MIGFADGRGVGAGEETGSVGAQFCDTSGVTDGEPVGGGDRLTVAVGGGDWDFVGTTVAVAVGSGDCDCVGTTVAVGVGSGD
jgi:hypothetical protein